MNPGYDEISYVDGVSIQVPIGWPPDDSFRLTSDQVAEVRNRLNESFDSPTDDEIARIHDAFEEVYLDTLLSQKLHFRCTTRCDPNDVAWWQLGKIRLCGNFFSGSKSYAASALIEELLHGYAGVEHPGATARPAEEADRYQAYLLNHYLNG